MSTLQDIQDSITELETTLSTIDTKLDDVASKIAVLQAGTPVSQEQIDAINSSLNDLKTEASKVLTETESL